jgi:predicted RNA-binding Zn-ribbon protein involved in translation (DUF1610 family)
MLNFFKRKKETPVQPQVQSRKIKEPTERRCPYCNILIDKKPTGKFKCPSCGGEIHIQKSGKKIKLLTKEQREELTAATKLQAAENKYLRFFADYDVSRDYLLKRRDEYFRKIGKGATYPDLTWSVAQGVLQKFAKTGNYEGMSSIYFSMALMLHREGRPFFHALHEYHKWNLYHYKEQHKDIDGVEVSIIPCGDSCPTCSELSGKRFTIDEALEQMPLPVKGCTTDGGWCRCGYGYHIKRDI